MRELTLDGRRIADDEPCYVIAEIGHNHGGDIAVCEQMIAAAATAGAHAAKLQKRENDTLYSWHLLNQSYESEHSYGATYGAHRHALEFGVRDYTTIMATAHHHRITWFATAFDEPSADFLVAMSAPAFKIASGGLTDLALLKYVGQFGKPIIVSTGGGTWKDVDAAVDVLSGTRSPFALLHCTAAYPIRDYAECNLEVIPAMRERYPETVIGWSSHDTGIALSLVAYAMGARIIEKHFTLNRASKGTDHAFSLEPKGLQTLCDDLQKAHVARGDGVKRWYESELKPIAKMRRRPTPDGLRVTGEIDAVY